MSEYKVGDRVRLRPHARFMNNDICTVFRVYDNPRWPLDILCDNGRYTFSISSDNIEPYTDPEPTTPDHITQLRAMTEDALSKGDYNQAAILANALAQLTPKPTT
jgi:elongation factor P hydroxylase